MPEQITLVVIAFAAGYMTRPRLERWWAESRPVHCPRCQRWVRFQHSASVPHRIAGRVRICDRCWTMIYRPSHADDDE